MKPRSAGHLERSTSKAMRHLLAILALAAVSAHAANPQQFEATCGATRFRVTAVNNGHPLDNTFSLSALTTSGARELFKGEEGGWFHAACLPAKDGKPVLVFQSYCGGSGCVEGKYGAIEPATLKLLLRPSSKNVENHKQLSALLGTSAPHLGNHKGAFCCGE